MVRLRRFHSQRVTAPEAIPSAAGTPHTIATGTCVAVEPDIAVIAMPIAPNTATGRARTGTNPSGRNASSSPSSTTPARSVTQPMIAHQAKTLTCRLPSAEAGWLPAPGFCHGGRGRGSGWDGENDPVAG